MRIAFIGPSNSVHLQRWVDWFRKNGHETFVISDSKAGSWDHDIIPIPSFNRILRGRFWKYGYEIENTRKALWLNNLLRKLKVELLQSHMLLYPGFIGLMSNFSPYAVHFYNGDILWKANTSLSHKLRTYWALKRADLVTAFSKAQVERCISLGSMPRQTHQIMMGIDLSMFKIKPNLNKFRKQLGVETDNIIFSPRGILSLYNTDNIIKAASLVVRKIPNALFIFGHLETQKENDYFAYINKMVSDLQLQHNVKFIGSIPYHEMPMYYACSKVTVSVAVSDNLPFSMMEAMASSSACVISNIKSIGELLQNQKNGLFVDPCNPTEIADAIIRLIEDDELRRTLTANAKDTVYENCDYEKWMKKLEEYYINLKAKRR
jgi:glycosyltransferase involved in cell wall biosynthesis